MRPGGRNLELTGAWRLEAAGWAGRARVEAGAGAASSLVVSAGSEGAGASWGIGMAATRARQVDTATRVGGTYLKVSMMQGVRVLLDFLSNTS